ncbi:MAG: cysteine--tRNA ligase [Cyclobacteriaceae bacterium]|nr:cysteine--tRNA ligase [Cyclobacteriaceae bacterium]
MKLFDKYPVWISNSLSNKKEKFVPVHAGNVGIYVCGPTVYQDVHLGNMRTFLSFDVITRYFRHLGYKVRYVRNITDVGHLVGDADEGEDKISKRARLEQLEPMEIVQKYTMDFHQVSQVFNMLPPDIEPSATGHILEQIEHTQKLLEKGLAYEVNGSVYFDVKKYNESHNYGKLSGRNIEDMQESGRSLDSQDEKRDKIDFALWKNASPNHIMRWNSPWGKGFPGWHLECTVMSTKYLGETFDIHGGGLDLKFPHHECEIAQSVGVTEKDPVNYWIHSNMLTVNGQKMSKSLGNSFLPHELFSGNHPLLERAFSPMTVRFFMLQSHYSSTLDFSNEALSAAEKGFKRLMNGYKTIENLNATGNSPDSELSNKFKELIDSLYTNMSDDFNTAKALAILFEMTTLVNDLYGKKISPKELDNESWGNFKTAYKSMITDVLGLLPEEEGNQSRLGEVVDLLIKIRKEAKEARDFKRSDQIRDELKSLGVSLMDGKDGTTYSFD